MRAALALSLFLLAAVVAMAACAGPPEAKKPPRPELGDLNVNLKFSPEFLKDGSVVAIEFKPDLAPAAWIIGGCLAAGLGLVALAVRKKP